MPMASKCLTLVVAIAAILSGCTEGPAYQEAAATQSAIPAGQGRIAVFRTQQVQAFGVKPAVLVNGLPTGKCEVDSVFFVDVSPGQYTVSASTMETSVATVNVATGQTSYVLCTIEVGALMGVPKLVQVNAASAAPKMKELVFTGKY
ncbi:DUF2846 domain-containing protein [Ruegeria sp. HKCCD4884]|uniref:DUF2846 domain-containing protein n=1 Tax=Ruegeria sp. HKCCD4884 TaxID=2683022 RepID=UPI001491BE24|nr:DUF2846 domain-containing protein [Ruegeria sp. HKCCD4884]NOD93656.1 DUF2846 domain-containing protein [Ruegeria sp. HKCCD4884]